MGECDPEVGPALEVWEGYAADPEIRRQASSGGLLSALALDRLEKKEGDGTCLFPRQRMKKVKPWTNKTIQSRNRSWILSRTGSRYAPASPCDELRLIEESDRPCVFIGKPCDTAAVAMLREKRPTLDWNLGLVLTFFCAGTPSTKGTLELMKSLNVGREETGTVRYRGEGWPGRFKVISSNGSGENPSLIVNHGVFSPSTVLSAVNCVRTAGTGRGHLVRRCMGKV